MRHDHGSLTASSISCQSLAEAAEIADILSQYGLGPAEYGPVVASLRGNPAACSSS